GQAVGPPDGLDARMRAQLGNILAEAGVDARRPGAGREEARDWLRPAARRGGTGIAPRWGAPPPPPRHPAPPPPPPPLPPPPPARPDPGRGPPAARGRGRRPVRGAGPQAHRAVRLRARRLRLLARSAPGPRSHQRRVFFRDWRIPPPRTGLFSS